MAEKEKMTVQEAGSLGGKERAKKYSPEELSEQAKRSAQTIEKKQPGFHSQIGEKGGKARGGQQSGSQQQQKQEKQERE